MGSIVHDHVHGQECIGGYATENRDQARGGLSERMVDNLADSLPENPANQTTYQPHPVPEGQSITNAPLDKAVLKAPYFLDRFGSELLACFLPSNAA